MGHQMTGNNAARKKCSSVRRWQGLTPSAVYHPVECLLSVHFQVSRLSRVGRSIWIDMSRTEPVTTRTCDMAVDMSFGRSFAFAASPIERISVEVTIAVRIRDRAPHANDYLSFSPTSR